MPDTMTLERTSLEKLASTTWDIIVIGGGISGAGVACEAARCGVKTLLLEQRDFAWGSSSRTSKMLHGGLRYLAQGQFRLTRSAVKERERFIFEIPGLAKAMPYILPSYRGEKLKRWQVGLILGLYDYFAGAKHRKYLSKDEITHAVPGIRSQNLLGGYEYIEGATDDARMVLRVLKEAVLNQAQVRNYSQVIDLIRDEKQQVCGVKVVDTSNESLSDPINLYAKVVINAAGVWTDLLRQRDKKIRPLRGSHILFAHERLPIDYVLFVKHPQDGRQVFIEPWMGCTVIGTTDLDETSELSTEPVMTANEADYLLALANYVFPNANLTHSDIRSCWTGLRPTIVGNADKPSELSREHGVWVEDGLYSIAGGKLTTFRIMAHDILERVSKVLPALKQYDRHARYIPEQKTLHHPTVDPEIIERLFGWYGQDTLQILQTKNQDQLQVLPGTQYLCAEIPFILATESVVHLDDLLLRRLRIGLICQNGGKDLFPPLKELTGWNDLHWERELQRYQAIWQKYYSYNPVVNAHKDEICKIHQ